MDFLKKICVRTHLLINGELINQGSGFILKHNDLYYIITADHCIHGEENEYANIKPSEIIIEHQDDFKSPFKKIDVIEIVDFNLQLDWALLKISPPEFIQDLDTVQKIDTDTKIEGRDINFRGFQNINTDEGRPFTGKIINIDVFTSAIKINSNVSSNQGSLQGKDVFGGLSGSGVFLVEDNRPYLVGVLTSMVTDYGINSDLNCCSIKHLEHLLGKDYYIPTTKTYQQITNESDSDARITREVVDYILSVKKDDSISKKRDNSDFREIMEKIPLNFPSTLIERVKRLFFKTFEMRENIKTYLNNLGEDWDYEILEETVVSTYCKIKETESPDIRIESIKAIESVAKSLLPINKQENDRYLYCSKAVVLHFFEICEIGIKNNQMKFF